MAIVAGDDILATHFTGTRYYAFSPADLTPTDDSPDWLIWLYKAQSNDDINFREMVGGVHLPHGAVVTSFKVYWFRDDALAEGEAALYRLTWTEGSTTMATANSDAATGHHSVEDATINNATIDNANYTYAIKVKCSPNNSKDDVKFCGAVITYTVTSPLP